MQLIALIMLVSAGIGITIASPVVSPLFGNHRPQKDSPRKCPCNQDQGDPPFADYCCT